MALVTQAERLEQIRRERSAVGLPTAGVPAPEIGHWVPPSGDEARGISGVRPPGWIPSKEFPYVLPPPHRPPAGRPQVIEITPIEEVPTRVTAAEAAAGREMVRELREAEARRHLITRIPIETREIPVMGPEIEGVRAEVPTTFERIEAETRRRRRARLVAEAAPITAVGEEVFKAAESAVLFGPIEPAPVAKMEPAFKFKETKLTPKQRREAARFVGGVAVGAVTVIPSIPFTISQLVTEPVETVGGVAEYAVTHPSRFLGEMVGGAAVTYGIGKGIARLRPPKITRAVEVGEIKPIDVLGRRQYLVKAKAITKAGRKILKTEVGALVGEPRPGMITFAPRKGVVVGVRGKVTPAIAKAITRERPGVISRLLRREARPTIETAAGKFLLTREVGKEFAGIALFEKAPKRIRGVTLVKGVREADIIRTLAVTEVPRGRGITISALRITKPKPPPITIGKAPAPKPIPKAVAATAAEITKALVPEIKPTVKPVPIPKAITKPPTAITRFAPEGVLMEEITPAFAPPELLPKLEQPTVSGFDIAGVSRVSFRQQQRAMEKEMQRQIAPPKFEVPTAVAERQIVGLVPGLEVVQPQIPRQLQPQMPKIRLETELALGLEPIVPTVPRVGAPFFIPYRPRPPPFIPRRLPRRRRFYRVRKMPLPEPEEILWGRRRKK